MLNATFLKHYKRNQKNQDAGNLPQNSLPSTNNQRLQYTSPLMIALNCHGVLQNSLCIVYSGNISLVKGSCRCVQFDAIFFRAGNWMKQNSLIEIVTVLTKFHVSTLV